MFDSRPMGVVRQRAKSQKGIKVIGQSRVRSAISTVASKAFLPVANFDIVLESIVIKTLFQGSSSRAFSGAESRPLEKD